MATLFTKKCFDFEKKNQLVFWICLTYEENGIRIQRMLGNLRNRFSFKPIATFLLLAVAGMQCPLVGQSIDLQPVPGLTERITDRVGIFSRSTKIDLGGKLKVLEDNKGSQIAVLTLATTQPESIEAYAIRVAQAWKIGRKGYDDGILVVFAREDRKVRIEVGYGLEGAVPDAIAKRIIREIMIPEFRKGDYEKGLVLGVEALIGIVGSEEYPPGWGKRDRDGIFRGLSSDDEMVLFSIFGVLGLVFFSIGNLLAFRSNRRIFFVLVLASLVFLGFLVWVVGSLAPALAFGLFFSGIVSFIAGIASLIAQSPGGYASGGEYNYGYSSHRSSGWGGSSGGGSSWGGGGGSFGGGGSSGSW